ncbi:MAG: CRISPR-associated endonuclease Cas1 [Fimbriimonadia bacterium]|nr:CRISPR-associated endonuclease Cas1 [Fimbriimonadia bacterium]
MQTLIIEEYGLFVGKVSERVSVKKGKETVSEHPMMDLEQILIAARGVSLSSDLVAECAARGISITFLDYSGKPHSKLVSPALTATVKTRREQLMAYQDERGVEIAKRFAEGKTRNQINLLRYFGKYRKQRHAADFAILEAITRDMNLLLKAIRAIDALTIQEARPTMLNLEGRASAHYWEGVRRLLPKSAFMGREGRGATDPVNALLNYGYGILYSQIWNALTLAGLEPFAGFLHVDRPGKPSMILDFIEEFRQPVVDRVVIALLNRRFALEWELPNEEELAAQHAGKLASADLQETRRLSSQTRKAFASKILERLEDPVPFEGKRIKLKNVIQKQARHVATFLRREGDYKPFVSSW